MSLFRKPKKIQRRVFSSNADDEDVQENQLSAGGSGIAGYGGDDDSMDADNLIAPPPPIISKKEKNKKSDRKESSDSKHSKPKSLLSFADDEDDGEIFQVRKSSHSKKVMRQLDKERRKKKREERAESSTQENGNVTGNNSNSNSSALGLGSGPHAAFSSSSTKYANDAKSAEQSKSKKSDNIQTEIRTDDFVLVVKKSETPAVVLNGRAALCAGRNDMSDEDESEDQREERNGRHRFSKPEALKQMLESGSIPDAAMIHAARKRRQRARELGDFVPIEEPKEQPKLSSRLPREDMEGDQSDDEERMDMNDITGRKEREERREQFYAVENDLSEEDSDRETNEWENQQIRKGVTGAQLVSAQQETVLSRFMIKPQMNALEYEATPQSTFKRLEQAYAKNAMDKSQHMLATASKVKKDKVKAAALRTPLEIRDAIKARLAGIKELNDKHTADMTRIATELKTLKLEELDCQQKAPTAAAKYRFYQEIKCYVNDLVDCLNEKLSSINELEKRYIQLYAKHQSLLVERRRQDVRDQAKEMAEASKPVSAATRRLTESEEQVRRAAEREGRRTRRRCERERNEMTSIHLDGMSSDDETSDHYQEQLQQGLAQIEQEASELFSDVTDDFHKPDLILIKFYAWRTTDMESYNDAFVNLCLPKVLGPLVRMEMLHWSPLLEEYKDIDNMNWYEACMLYAINKTEKMEQLKTDPDVHLVPNLIERIVLPKLTEIVKHCWDPLSTTQTLRLISLINRLGRDYPLKSTSKQLKLLFEAVLESMRLALENDVFIPIFPKQVQEAKTSFFQRQFCSGLKLFRNFLSWQGIVADKPLRELAIGSLLNRYLLLAMRVCTANDAISKAYIIVNTLPTVWLQPNSETLKNLELLINYIRQTLENCDASNPLFMQSSDKAKQILQRLHSL